MTVSPEVLTASLTLIGGVLIFIISRFLIKLLAENFKDRKIYIYLDTIYISIDIKNDKNAKT